MRVKARGRGAKVIGGRWEVESVRTARNRAAATARIGTLCDFWPARLTAPLALGNHQSLFRSHRSPVPRDCIPGLRMGGLKLKALNCLFG